MKLGQSDYLKLAILRKFHEDRTKIVDFLQIVTFLASCKFAYSPPSECTYNLFKFVLWIYIFYRTILTHITHVLLLGKKVASLILLSAKMWAKSQYLVLRCALMLTAAESKLLCTLQMFISDTPILSIKHCI